MTEPVRRTDKWHIAFPVYANVPEDGEDTFIFDATGRALEPEEIVEALNAARPEGEPSNAERDRHIEGFRDLNANWDSYGAEKLPDETIQLALRVSKTLSAEWKVIPCADGPSVWFYRGDEDEIIQVWASV